MYPSKPVDALDTVTCRKMTGQMGREYPLDLLDWPTLLDIMDILNRLDTQ